MKNTNKYVEFTNELKKLWNMKIAAVPVVIRTQGAETKSLGKD